MSAANLRRIECARRRCALADDLILCSVDGNVGIRPIALAFLARGSLGARQPPKAEAKHDDRGDDAKTWRRERSGTEKRHRDRVLMGSAARFLMQFFLIFLLGALFRKLMEDSGSVPPLPALWPSAR